MLSNRIKQPLGLYTTPTSTRDDMPQPIPLPKAETSEVNVRDIDRHPRNDGPPSTVQVTFNVFAKTVPGENVYVTGSIQELGSWSSNDARILHCTQSYPMWTVTVELPAGKTFNYKYIRKFHGPEDFFGW
ncbi:hypothetical protein FRB90_008199, partial [Tulasnella sp. 427]